MRSITGHLRGLTLFLGSMTSSVKLSSDYPYLQDGPCGALPGAHYTVFADVVNATNDVQAQRKLSVTVTIPAHSADPSSASWQISRTAPYPVIFFFNGFLVKIQQIMRIGKQALITESSLQLAVLFALQLKSAYYSAYANRLATWGYAVVQYDTGRWPILNDRQEVRCLIYACASHCCSPASDVHPSATWSCTSCTIVSLQYDR